MKKKILIISHDFVKKVNIRIYEELNKKKNLEIPVSKLKIFSTQNKDISIVFRN